MAAGIGPMSGPAGTAPALGYTESGPGVSIAYHRSEGKSPGVVFLGGFMSDMTGTKALALEAQARRLGHAFLRFDYRGHGQSSGRFEDGTIGLWTADALAAIDRLTSGPLVLVGSSMGGWIMLLVARARPERIAGLVGIAAAPDFTEDLVAGELTAEQRAVLEREGVVYQPSPYGERPYAITRRLIEDGRRNLVMNAPFALERPVRLLHGMRDPDVPWRRSIALAEHLASPDVRITLVKDGDHRLSRDQDLALIGREVAELLAAQQRR